MPNCDGFCSSSVGNIYSTNSEFFQISNFPSSRNPPITNNLLQKGCRWLLIIFQNEFVALLIWQHFFTNTMKNIGNNIQIKCWSIAENKKEMNKIHENFHHPFFYKEKNNDKKRKRAYEASLLIFVVV